MFAPDDDASIIPSDPKSDNSATALKNRKLSYFNYLMLFLLLLVAVASNWVYSYHNVGASVSVKPQWMYPPEFGSFSMGGWPLKYYVQSSSDENSIASFSVLRLLGNVGIWILIGSCYYLYLRYQRRQIREAKSKWTMRLLDVFVYTTVVAVAIFYSQVLLRRSKQHRDYGQKISSQGGKYAIAAYLPAPLKPLAGWGLAKACERLSAVQLVHPTKEQIQQALQIPYLQGLYLQGGDYDLRLLDDLPTLPLLKSVGVGGRRLDSQFVATLSRSKQLHSISLPRTNITRDGLDALGEMPYLEELGLLHTNVQCEFETVPVWAKNIVRIQLPRPPAGQKFVHQLIGWPKLQVVECLGGAEARNTEGLALELRGLPSLKKISLDVLQSFDLTLADIPNLIQLEGDESEPQRIQKKSDYLPKLPNLRSINLSNIAAGQALSIDVAEIERATLDNCQGIKLSLLVSDESKVDDRPRGSMIAQVRGSMMVEDSGFRQHRVDKLVKSLEGSQGLESLSIPNCNTGNVNWTSLSNNADLRKLSISALGMDAGRIREIGSIKSIENLELLHARLQGKQLTELVAALPALKSVVFNHDSIDQLTIENHENIETLFYSGTSPPLAIQSVKLLNVPKYRDYIVLDPYAQSVVIENAPSLPGIILNGPSPKSTKFAGLQNLKVFVGGGLELNDEQIQEILKSKEIESLALCHCQLSDETLAMIAGLPNLTSLCLTGTKVTEQVADQISNTNFPKLNRLWVSDTGLGGDRWEKLVLQLNREAETLYIDRPTPAILAKLPSFYKIHGIGLRHATLQAADMGWTDVNFIEQELNLDGSVLDEQAMNELTKRHRSVRRVSMRGAQVPGNGLIRFMANASYAVFDIEDLKTDAGVVEQIHANQNHRLREQGDFYRSPSISLTLFLIHLVDPERFSPRAKEKLLPMLADDGQRINEPVEDSPSLIQAIIHVWSEITFWNRNEQ